MKTDKEWLKETVRKLCDYEDDNRLNIKAYKMIGLIDKLDEPEVERLNKKIIELDHFNSELIRDNNQFRNELDNQEVLSQEWIDEHEIHYNHWVGAVPVTELQNLLVPKQEEITHKQVEKYLLDKNIRVIDIDIYEEMQSELEELKDDATLSKTETVADVLTTFWKSYERLKEVMNMEVEELEE